MKQAEWAAFTLAAAFMLSSSAFAADDPTWTVDQTDEIPARMKLTLDVVTIDYHLVPGDYDEFKLSVEPCDNTRWYAKDSLAPDGADDIKKAMADAFRNARLNCKLSEGLEDRFLAGFDVAYAQFQKLSQ